LGSRTFLLFALCFSYISIFQSVSLNKRKGPELKKCPAAQKLVQDPTQVPHVNGCGPEGDGFWKRNLNSFLNKLTPEFVGCCSAHDACYGTCHPRDKKMCDSTFNDCMKAKCGSKTICKGLAFMFYEAVNMLGSGAYNGSQNRVCKCA